MGKQFPGELLVSLRNSLKDLEAKRTEVLNKRKLRCKDVRVPKVEFKQFVKYFESEWVVERSGWHEGVSHHCPVQIMHKKPLIVSSR